MLCVGAKLVDVCDRAVIVAWMEIVLDSVVPEDEKGSFTF